MDCRTVDVSCESCCLWVTRTFVRCIRKPPTKSNAHFLVQLCDSDRVFQTETKSLDQQTTPGHSDQKPFQSILLCVVSFPLCSVVMWSVVRLIGDSEEADTGINHDSTFDGSDGSRLIPASLSFNSWSAPISQTTNVFSHLRHSLHFSQGGFSDFFAIRH